MRINCVIPPPNIVFKRTKSTFNSPDQADRVASRFTLRRETHKGYAMCLFFFCFSVTFFLIIIFKFVKVRASILEKCHPFAISTPECQLVY